MFLVYIIFSITKNKYYIGHTGSSLEDRIKKHNSNHKGFTGGIGDWKIAYSKPYGSKTEAYQAELAIKNKKSRKYIEDLISSAGSEYPA